MAVVNGNCSLAHSRTSEASLSRLITAARQRAQRRGEFFATHSAGHEPRRAVPRAVRAGTDRQCGKLRAGDAQRRLHLPIRSTHVPRNSQSLPRGQQGFSLCAVRRLCSRTHTWGIRYSSRHSIRRSSMRYWSMCQNDRVIPYPVIGCQADFATLRDQTQSYT